MGNDTLQNNIRTITKREILWFLTITVLVGLVSSLLSFREQFTIITFIIGFWLLLIVFPKAKVYTLLATLPGIILLIFLVPGSINLSVVIGLGEMKTAVGINLNGIRLLLFCLIAGIYLIRRGTISKPFKIYCIFLLYYFFTLSYTLDLTEGIRLFAKLLVPLLIYMVAKSVLYSNFEKINKAFIGVVFLHLPFVLLILMQWFKPFGGIGGIPRASGLSGGMIIFGTFMVFMFVLFYYRNLISQKETGKKNFLLILVCLLGVILSGSRIAWIGLLVAMFMLGVFKKVKSIIIVGILAVLLIAFFGPLLQHRIGVQMVEGKLIFGGYGAGPARHRLLIWNWLLQEKIPQRIFWGYGLGSTKNILSELPKAGIPMLDYPANEYIRLLLEGGIIGIFLFLGSFFYLALFFIRKYKNILFILPIVVYLIFCLADNTLNYYFENGALFAYTLVYLEKCFARNRAIDGEKSNILLSEKKEEA